MNINILLPHKELFEKNKLSSVSITVKNNFIHSKFKKNIKIFGQKVENPMFQKNFIGIENPKLFFKSKNKNLAMEMCKSIDIKDFKSMKWNDILNLDIIEYIDFHESENILISTDIKDSTKNYTHYELVFLE